jgi:cytochrome c oxidase assembly protein subunit 15
MAPVRSAAVREFRVSADQYRRVCLVALLLICVVVVSGAAVRLTGSGLGCDDWPNCNAQRFVDVRSEHSAIEQVNRLFTGLVSAGVIVAVLASLRRSPQRRDLTWLSVGLVCGVLAQIVLGGITVLVDLHPAAVQAHLLLSMALVANAVVLWSRASMPSEQRRHRIGRSLRRHVWVCAAATAIAIVFGTVVTGAGPHAGDEEARRFGISITRAAQMHSVAVWLAVGCVAALMVRLRHRAAERMVLDGPLVLWICVAVTQAGVGYLQYFTGVPAALVAAHVAGATLLWAVTVGLTESMSISVTHEILGPGDPGASQAPDELGSLVDDRREETTDVTDEVPERVRAATGVAPERDEQEQHQHGEAQLLHGFERHGTTSN